ncbi:nuclear transport factor 2 family protein [Aquimarina sp. I32.4]|uniref:nuclear transport factor 2 family protein n=1 Tax=Aquimarina sp. I32.4 TaxID=2053903 RepID=UPI000CDF1368|nr:nuclear transport factor 2 family protein [Aquimarina sp. I32.4]
MSNKEKAKAYHTAVSEYDESTIKKMVHEGYIQHNPKVPSGRAAFISMIPKLKAYGSKIENIRMLEDGNHIIMHHKWINAIPFGFDETAAFHIIRFDNTGLIAEHWNVMTEMGLPNASDRSLLDGKTEINDLNKTEMNKSKIIELFNLLTNEGVEKIITTIPQFFQTDFHQHNMMLSDGVESLIKAVQEGSLFPRYIKQHAVFGEGNFVLSISEGMLSEKKTALYDLFRLEEGKVAAHWSISQDIPTENLANNNTMFNF